MTYAVSTPAGLLSTIPVSLGKYPANSVVAMTIEGTSLGATLRLDKPTVMDAQFMDTFTSYLAKAPADKVVLAVFSSGHQEGRDLHYEAEVRKLADYITTHLPVTVMFTALVTPDYWADYEDGNMRPALEIEGSSFVAEVFANGEAGKNSHPVPEVTPDAVFHRDVAEHFGEWIITDSVLFETWNMYLEGVGTPTRAEALDIMAAMHGGSLRDGLLCRVFLEEVGEADFGPVLLGTHPAPFNRDRYDRGLELFKHLATLDAPGQARAGVLAGLGWLHWHAGRGTAAVEHLDAGLEADEGNRLCSLLREVIHTRGKLSPIASVKSNWVTN